MIFVTLDDLKMFIKDNVLNAVSENDYTILDQLETLSISTIDSYIGHYFDTELIFRQTDVNRNANILQILIDIMLYNMASRLTPTQVPEIRTMRYKDACSWLEKVGKGVLTPNLPSRDKTREGSSQVWVSGNYKISSQY